MERPKAIHVVYATWCPHCVPALVGLIQERAEALGIPCLLHDIDTAEEQVADELVRKYGDWTPDYLVPQVFLEYEGTRFRHVLTGDPRGVDLTRMAVERLLSGDLLAESK
jgi:thiol-disulfide isomerase/thioredoxin